MCYSAPNNGSEQVHVGLRELESIKLSVSKLVCGIFVGFFLFVVFFVLLVLFFFIHILIFLFLFVLKTWT